MYGCNGMGYMGYQLKSFSNRFIAGQLLEQQITWCFGEADGGSMMRRDTYWQKMKTFWQMRISSDIHLQSYNSGLRINKDEEAPQHQTPLALWLCHTQPGKWLFADSPQMIIHLKVTKQKSQLDICKILITRHFAGQWLSSSAALERAQYCCLRLEIQNFKQNIKSSIITSEQMSGNYNISLFGRS